jgi:putative nucleotidyltransferase with HDIG domain
MTVAIDIPALPVGYERALMLLRYPDPTVEELSRVIDSDPALTSAVLRAANSVISAPVNRVSTARLAVARLGVQESRRMVIATTLGKAFPGVRGSGIDEREMWRHLIASGVIADMLAWGEVHHSQAFTAGLLHDIGRLAMASSDPQRYARVVELVGCDAAVLEAEEEVFGHSHLEWGEAVAWNWDFPAELTAAITDHHEGNRSRLGWLVADARRIAYSMGIGNGVNPPPDPGEGADMVPDLLALGGIDFVEGRIGWFQGALGRAA